MKIKWLNGEGQVVNDQHKLYTSKHYIKRCGLNFTTPKMSLAIAADLTFYGEKLWNGKFIGTRQLNPGGLESREYLTSLNLPKKKIKFQVICDFASECKWMK